MHVFVCILRSVYLYIYIYKKRFERERVGKKKANRRNKCLLENQMLRIAIFIQRDYTYHYMHIYTVSIACAWHESIILALISLASVHLYIRKSIICYYTLLVRNIAHTGLIKITILQVYNIRRDDEHFLIFKLSHTHTLLYALILQGVFSLSLFFNLSICIL